MKTDDFLLKFCKATATIGTYVIEHKYPDVYADILLVSLEDSFILSVGGLTSYFYKENTTTTISENDRVLFELHDNEGTLMCQFVVDASTIASISRLAH